MRQFSVGFQVERTISTPTISVLTGGAASAYTPFSLSMAVLYNAKSFNGNLITPGAASALGYISAAAITLSET